MIKKLFFWIVGACLTLALAGYVLLFTPLGHSLFKPLLQSKLDSLSPIRLEITEFELTFTTLNLVLKNGEYIDQYNGSFFGFAKDSKRTYTIGVVVFQSHIQNDYYGGRTAAPIFKEIVEMLVSEGYLEQTQKENAQALEPSSSL